MSADKTPTVKDVARRVGVSYATAAAALRDAPTVAAATKQRVLQAARALGYQPNRAAANLVARRYSHAPRAKAVPLAFLVWVKQADNHAGSAILKGARLRAGELGYELNQINLQDHPSPEKVGDRLYAQGYEGIIIGRIHPHHFDQLPLPWEKFSIVTVGQFDRHHGFHCVREDHTDTLRQAYGELVKRGCRRIGAIFRQHTPQLLDDRDRTAAVMELEHHHRLPPIPPYGGGLSEANGIVSWFKSHRLDGVVSMVGTPYFPLADAGIMAPRDYLFASLKEPATAGAKWPLSGLASIDYELGQIAVDMLDSEIRFQRRGVSPFPKDTIVRSHWQTRASTER